jgi:LmbE family N-acetylglucosaminyl deacetylase
MAEEVPGTAPAVVAHPDHIAAARAALAATFAARDRLTVPEPLAEGLPPHGIEEVSIAGGRSADVWVDIGPLLERKKQALRLHRSPITEEFLAVVEAIARDTAARPSPRPAFAECFRLVRL